MKKITLFLSAMIISMMSMAQTTVTFGPEDFLGKGTSGTGSPVEVTKDGVTVSCDKGYGNEYAFRCYKDGVVTISATQNIVSLEFSFDTYNDRYYNGDLEESYTVGETSWSTTLASQVRFTSIVVTLGEGGGETPDTPDTPDTPNTPDTPEGAIVFDADVDKGNAIIYTDGAQGAEFTVTKNGITMTVSSGLIGTYNSEMQYRIYKGSTLTLTSTVGNIVSVEFTCTANDNAKYGPGNFAVDGGSYTYSGPIGTWTGDAASVVFTASTAQVRATQIVVKIAGGTTGVEDVTTIEIPVKVMQNGQVLIIRGENTYNVLGAQVK